MRLLQEGARSLGLTLTPQHLAAFELYYRELTEWNARFNLTAITGYEEVQCRHFVDSLTCLLALPQGEGAGAIPDTVPLQRVGSPSIADVGSGAGFPGLPLKILLPDVRLLLVEATGKKVRFLRHMVALLGLQGVEVIHARAEEVGRLPEHRERYDLVAARAVGHTAVLAEYCLPLCRMGGRMVAPKGQEAERELEESREAIRVLGGEPVAVKPLRVDCLPEGRYLVIVEKRRPTPEAYPRRIGVAARRPLGSRELRTAP